MQKINFKDLPNTTTPINGSNLNNMQSNIEEAIEITYSTSEINTGKKWINGKSIYRKIMSITSQDTQHNISNLGDIIFESAIVYLSNYYGRADISNDVVIQSNKIWLKGSALDNVSRGILLIFEYTKTSD